MDFYPLIDLKLYANLRCEIMKGGPNCGALTKYL